MNITSGKTEGLSLQAFGTNNSSFCFSLPLIGCLNTTKFFPCFLGEATIELTIASLSDYIVSISGGAVTAFSISNIEYVCETIELTPESFTMVMQDYPSQMTIKSVRLKDRLGMLDTIDPIVRHLRPPHPRSVVGVDTLTVTPADKDGNYLLIVVVNHFTKFTALYPAKDHNALTVATALFIEFHI
jgi:hypothetical protein